jgi:hypothetical protein
METITNVIKGMFTPEQWIRIMGWLIDTGIVLLNNALSVMWVVFLIFATTQMVKITWRRSKLKGPPEWAIHGVSLLSAGGWGFTQNDSHVLDERAAMALVAWFITWLVVTYGGEMLKTYRPKIWSAINADRRKLDLGPPPATPGRRKEDQ